MYSPGATTTTSTPLGRNSCFKQAARASRADKRPLCTPRTGDATRHSPDVMKTMRPLARRTNGSITWVRRVGPRRLISVAFLITCGENESDKGQGCFTPQCIELLCLLRLIKKG